MKTLFMYASKRVLAGLAVTMLCLSYTYSLSISDLNMMYLEFYWSTFEKGNMCYQDPGEESTVRETPPDHLKGLPMMVMYRHDRKHEVEDNHVEFTVNQEINLYILCKEDGESWMGSKDGWSIDAGWPNEHDAYKKSYSAGTITLRLNDGNYFCVVEPKGEKELVLSRPKHVRPPYEVYNDPGFHRDIEPFIDESEKFDDMSSTAEDSLGGLTVIKSRDGDRRVCGNIFRFNTDEDVTLYTLYCEDREAPSWLDDWNKKSSWDMHIHFGGYGEDYVPKAKDFPAGSHLFKSWRIPGNSSSGEGRMYFVVAKGKGTKKSNPPTVSITSPSDGSQVPLGSTTVITAEADDDGSVEKVEFYVGNKLINTDNNGSDGWSVEWDVPRNDVHDTAEISPNITKVMACAFDNNGARMFSKEIEVDMVDNDTIIPVTGVSLNKNSLTIDEGQSEQLIETVSPSDATNKSVTWSSSDDNVATVEQDGTVNAIYAGSATITVTTDDGGYTATCDVTVNDVVISVSGVSLNKNSLTLPPGANETLEATVSPSNADDQTISWENDNESVATVDDSGTVSAVAEGNAHIIVTTNDGGYKDTCNVVVSDSILKINAAGPEISDFKADQQWTNTNSYGYSGGDVSTSKVGEDVSGTDLDSMYTFVRHKDFEYYVIVPAEQQNYNVTLHFVEYWRNAGERVFKMSIEGDTTQKIDVAGEVGNGTAMTLTKEVYVSDGILNIKSVRLHDNNDNNPMLSGIEVVAPKSVSVADVDQQAPIEIWYANQRLHVKDAEQGTLKIMDIYGKVLREKLITEQSATFDLHNLTKGIYIVHVNSPKGDRTKKIIK